MFRHLLVPLDGSRLAEAALPAAAVLAEALAARVMLLHVLEPGAPATVHGEPHLTRPAEANAYLQQVREWMAAQRVATECEVHRGPDDVAGSIAKRSADLSADLVVLTTHGRGGVRALLFGRVAQQVLARGMTPVLLVPPSEAGRERPFSCRRVLVPLDGSHTAEAALPVAADLAHALVADIVLVWVVPTVDTASGDRAAATRLMPSAAAALFEAEASMAAGYLEQVAARLRQGGIETAAVVGRGETVRVLRETMGKRAVDLVVMATHGRAGAAAVWEGSVAARLAEGAAWPMLLIRISAPPA